LEVVERQSLSAKVIDKCICPQGTFWHWRINKCQNQGGWGYECGFFPKEHWPRICADGLTCKPVPNSSDVYYSYGRHHGTAGSRPATCQTCGPEDDCKLAEDRHNGDCLRGVELSGNATATIRVTVSSSATATATASHTAEAEEAERVPPQPRSTHRGRRRRQASTTLRLRRRSAPPRLARPSRPRRSWHAWVSVPWTSARRWRRR